MPTQVLSRERQQSEAKICAGLPFEFRVPITIVGVQPLLRFMMA